jgi:hypothetical protein
VNTKNLETQEKELLEGYRKLKPGSKIMIKTILNTAVLAQEAALHGNLIHSSPVYLDRQPVPMGEAANG